MASNDSFNFSEVNLLILEEYLFIADVLSLMLKNFGIRKIHKATSLLEAKTICEKAHAAGAAEIIDFAIVDLSPPNNHGFNFLKWLRQHPQSSIQYVPVIFTTNDSSERIIISGRDCGANEILIKPFTAYNISRRLLSIINNPRAFVKSENYSGPSRRRREKEFDTVERRLIKQEDIKVVYEENVA